MNQSVEKAAEKYAQNKWESGFPINIETKADFKAGAKWASEAKPAQEKKLPETYPGKEYQRLFNYLKSEYKFIALQSEMDELISIVREDFCEAKGDDGVDLDLIRDAMRFAVDNCYPFAETEDQIDELFENFKSEHITPKTKQ